MFSLTRAITHHTSEDQLKRLLDGANVYSYRTEKIILLLLEKGADVNETDYEGVSPLMHAAFRVKKRGTENILKLLLMMGADIDKINHYCDTVLMIAVKEEGFAGTKNAVGILLETDTDAFMKTDYSENALQCAVARVAYSSSTCVTTCVITMLIENAF